ncbi:MAG: LamG domain-containing protein [Cytophagales bacterium]|nr:LamG domain-containing protein [Cytophagales bacterium]
MKKVRLLKERFQAVWLVGLLMFVAAAAPFGEALAQTERVSHTWRLDRKLTSVLNDAVHIGGELEIFADGSAAHAGGTNKSSIEVVELCNGRARLKVNLAFCYIRSPRFPQGKGVKISNIRLQISNENNRSQNQFIQLDNVTIPANHGDRTYFSLSKTVEIETGGNPFRIVQLYAAMGSTTQANRPTNVSVRFSSETNPLLQTSVMAAMKRGINFRSAKAVYQVNETPVLRWKNFLIDPNYSHAAVRLVRARKRPSPYTDSQPKYFTVNSAKDEIVFRDTNALRNWERQYEYWIEAKTIGGCNFERISDKINVKVNELNDLAKSLVFSAETFSADPDISVELNYAKPRRMEDFSKFIRRLVLKRQVVGNAGVEKLFDRSDQLFSKFTDERVLRDVVYTYELEVHGQYDDGTRVTKVLRALGFHKPRAVVNGHIQYSGGVSVEDVRVDANIQGEIEDRESRSLLFSGPNDYVDIGNIDESKFTGGFTVEAWVKVPSSERNRSMMIFESIQTNAGGTIIQFEMHAQGALSLNVANFNGSTFRRVDGVIAYDKWQHVAATLENGTVKFFVNGKLVSTQTGVGMPAAIDRLYNNLGKTQVDNHLRYFKGNMDEVRIWSKPLPENRIAHDYNRFLSGKEDGLYLYYQFDTDIWECFDTSDGDGDLLHAFYGGNLTHSSDVPSKMKYAGYTDRDGNYTIYMPFSATGQNVEIRPTYQNHSFSPRTKVLYLSDKSSIHNGVDFEDISSFRVKGKVTYDGTPNCAAEGVMIAIDGEIARKFGEAVTVQADGTYELDVPIGEHVITPVKQGHTFSTGRFPAQGAHNFQGALNDINFVDNTKYRLVGKVVGGVTERNKMIKRGGTVNNIGQARIRLQSFNECFDYTIETDDETGEYDVQLPPMDFNIISVDVEDNPSIIFSTSEPIRLGSTNGVTQIEKDSIVNEAGTKEEVKEEYHLRRDFIHRVEPAFEVIRKLTENTPQTLPNNVVIDTYISEKSIVIGGDSETTISNLDTNNPFGQPIFVQGRTYNVELFAYEKYTRYDRIRQVHYYDPLKEGTYTINNNLSGSEAETITIDADGKEESGIDNTVGGRTAYSFTANNVNLNANANFPEISYTNTFEILLETRNGDKTFGIKWEPIDPNSALAQKVGDSYYRGIVLGDVERPNSFTTYRGPDLPLDILRDPPGSNSYGFIEKGASKSVTMNVEFEGSLANNFKLGTISDGDVLTGIGIAVTATKIKGEASVGNDIAVVGGFKKSSTVTASYNRSVQTNSQPYLTGTPSDVFIGVGSNIIVGEADDLTIVPEGQCASGTVNCITASGAYRLAKKEVSKVGVSFDTEFFYSHDHIKKEVIPRLESIRDQVGQKKSTKDSAQMHINNWINTLAKNEEQRAKAKPYKMKGGTPGYEKSNISIQGGVPVSYTVTENNSGSFERYGSTTINLKVNVSQAIAVSGTGILIENETVTGINTGGGQVQANENFTNRGFVISDEDKGDFMSVDLLVDDQNRFAFRTVAGQTRCPFEPEYRSEFYDPQNDGNRANNPILSNGTQQIEKPNITISPNRIINIPEGEEVNINVTLAHETESRSNIPIEYDWGVISETNPYGAVFYIVESGNAEGNVVLSKTQQSVVQTITVSSNPGIARTDYGRIGLWMRSSCQGGPGGEIIADTTWLELNFLPSVTKAEIIRPFNKFVFNNLKKQQDENGIFVDVVGDNRIPITVGSYNYNDPRLEKIQVQYKLSKQGDSEYRTLETYYRHPDLSRNEKPIPSDKEFFVYNWNLEDRSIKDGEYDIRVVVRGEGVDEVVEDGRAHVIRGTIDRVRPTFFGKPQPKDGILTHDSELLVQFNEPIDEQRLVSARNFEVRTVRTQSEVSAADYSFAEFDGKKDVVKIPGHKGFEEGTSSSVELWFKTTGKNMQPLLTTGLTRGADGLPTGMYLGLDNGRLYLVSRFNFDNESVRIDNTNSLLNDGKWHHVVVEVDESADKLRSYVDGKKVLERPITRSYTSSSTKPLCIGAFNSKTFFKGQIREFRTWSKTRTLAEIKAKKDVTLVGNENGLSGYWPLDDATGTAARDLTTRHPGTFNGRWAVSSQNGFAYAFGAEGLNVRVPHFNFDRSQDFTLEGWFKLANAGGALISTGDEESDWKVKLRNTDKKLILEHGGNTYVLTNTAVQLNTWFHLALRMEREEFLVAFLNSGREKEVPLTNLGDFNASNITFGKGANGAVDELRFWNVARTPRQITNYFGKALHGNELALEYYLPFDRKTEALSREAVLADIAGQRTVRIAGTSSFSNLVPQISQRNVSGTLDFTYTVNNDKIYFELEDELNRLEGLELDITITGVKDKNGNTMASAETWTVLVDRSNLLWKNGRHSYQKMHNEAMTFELKIQNKSTQAQNYNLRNLPVWLTVPEKSGVIDGNSLKTIGLTVDPNLAIGNYKAVLSMTGEQGIAETFPISLKVKGAAPNWTVNPENFRESMNFIGQLQVNGSVSMDVEDRIAAVINGEVRGVAQPVYNQALDRYFVYLDVYHDGNSQPIIFKVWDASTGRTYSNVLPSNVNFTAQAIKGSVTSPVSFITQDVVERTYSLPAGKSFISFNVKKSPSTVDEFFASIKSSLRSVISHELGTALPKSQTVAEDQSQFAGTLTTIDVKKAYYVDLKEAVSFTVSGAQADVSSTSISLKQGWNWISYLPQHGASVTEVMAALNPATGDVVKSHTQFAIYDKNAGWVGSLTSMEPGKGYRVKLAAAQTFAYPGNSHLENLTNMRSSARTVRTSAETVKGINPNRYLNTMSVIARIPNATPEAILSASAQGSLVGAARVVDVQSAGEDYFFLTVYGTENEKVEFVLDDNQENMKARETVKFRSNQVVGTLAKPLNLTFNSEAGLLKEAEAYPNPFGDKLTVALNAGRATDARVVLRDLSGRQVEVIFEDQLSEGTKEIVWDAQSLSPGIYLLSIETGDENQVIKVVKK